MDNLTDVFVHELEDLYDAERRFLVAQKEFLRGDSDEQLKEIIRQHMEESERQIEILDDIFTQLHEEPGEEACQAAQGLVEEGDESVNSAGSAEVRDALIVAVLSKVEHYEIATYRYLVSLAEQIMDKTIVELLKKNLAQEEQAAELMEQTSPRLLQAAQPA